MSKRYTDGLTKSQRYHLKHKDEEKAWAKEWSRTHRDVENARARKYRKTEKNQLYRKNYDLIRTSGFTLEEKQEMYSKQNGQCRICHKNISFEESCADHNHITKKKRGILCNGCNIGLGIFKDNIDHLLSAVAYLKENQ